MLAHNTGNITNTFELLLLFCFVHLFNLFVSIFYKELNYYDSHCSIKIEARRQEPAAVC